MSFQLDYPYSHFQNSSNKQQFESDLKQSFATSLAPAAGKAPLPADRFEV